MSQQKQKQKQREPYISPEDPSEVGHKFFIFHLPFLGDRKNDDIISNGRAVFTSNTLEMTNPPSDSTAPTLEQWVAANYPKVKRSYLAFRINEPFIDEILPEAMKQNLQEVCKGLGPVLLKQSNYIHVDVGTPAKWQGFEDSELKMLKNAQQEIKRMLEKELEGLGMQEPKIHLGKLGDDEEEA